MKRDILCDYPFFVAFLKAHRKKGWSSLFYIKKNTVIQQNGGYAEHKQKEVRF